MSTQKRFLSDHCCAMEGKKQRLTNSTWCLHKDCCVWSVLHISANFPLQHPSELEKCFYPFSGMRSNNYSGIGPKMNGGVLNRILLQRVTRTVKQGHFYFFNVLVCSSAEVIAGDTEGKRRWVLHTCKLQTCPADLET